MSTVDPHSRDLVKYLLGELSESEQTAFEERFFDDDELYQVLCVTEDELIDQYVTGHLPQVQRPLFEQRFLTNPHRRERVEFARALHEKAGKHRTQQPSAAQSPSWWRRLRERLNLSEVGFPQFAFAAVMLGLLVGSTLVVMDNRRMRTELEHFRSENAAIQQQTAALTRQIEERVTQAEHLNEELAQTRALNSQLEQKLNELKPAVVQKVAEAVISFVLKAGTLRDEGESQKITITKTNATVVLKLQLLANMTAPSYKATLTTVNDMNLDQFIWSAASLKPQSSGSKKYVNCQISAKLLKPDDYILTLTDSSDPEGESADYSFAVN
ncbi:MAG: hypothetical protein HY774_07095 [Acidobacteria bacterium]|nr:hypothetical protein [Acidobacteriota bacterium]